MGGILIVRVSQEKGLHGKTFREEYPGSGAPGLPHLEVWLTPA